MFLVLPPIFVLHIIFNVSPSSLLPLLYVYYILSLMSRPLNYCTPPPPTTTTSLCFFLATHNISLIVELFSLPSRLPLLLNHPPTRRRIAYLLLDLSYLYLFLLCPLFPHPGYSIVSSQENELQCHSIPSNPAVHLPSDNHCPCTSTSSREHLTLHENFFGCQLLICQLSQIGPLPHYVHPWSIPVAFS